MASASARPTALTKVVSGIDELSDQVGLGEGALAPEGDRGLDLLDGLGLDGRGVVGGEPALLDAVALQAQDRIHLLPLRVGDRLAVGGGIALVVAAQADGQALEQEGALARAGALQEPAEVL